MDEEEKNRIEQLISIYEKDIKDKKNADRKNNLNFR